MWLFNFNPEADLRSRQRRSMRNSRVNMHPVLLRLFQRNPPRIVRLAEMKTILAQALHDQVYDEEVMFALYDQQTRFAWSSFLRVITTLSRTGIQPMEIISHALQESSEISHDDIGAALFNLRFRNGRMELNARGNPNRESSGRANSRLSIPPPPPDEVEMNEISATPSGAVIDIDDDEDVELKAGTQKEEEIPLKMEEKRTKGGPLADGHGEECVVCCDRNTDTTLPCEHVFCRECAARCRKCPLCRQEYDPTPYRDPNRVYDDDDDDQSMDLNFIDGQNIVWNIFLQQVLGQNFPPQPQEPRTFWESICLHMEPNLKPFAVWFTITCFVSLICVLQFWIVSHSQTEDTFVKWWIPQIYIALILFFAFVNRFRTVESEMNFSCLFCSWIVVFPIVPLMFPLAWVTNFYLEYSEIVDYAPPEVYLSELGSRNFARGDEFIVVANVLADLATSDGSDCCVAPLSENLYNASEPDNWAYAFTYCTVQNETSCTNCTTFHSSNRESKYVSSLRAFHNESELIEPCWIKALQTNALYNSSFPIHFIEYDAEMSEQEKAWPHLLDGFLALLCIPFFMTISFLIYLQPPDVDFWPKCDTFASKYFSQSVVWLICIPLFCVGLFSNVIVNDD